ncbi:MAG: sigma-70 family RNA polymerase sigma factor [Planctomycetota bacterium]
MPDAAADHLEPTDEALAAAARGGCVRSYETLDRRYRARLVHLLTRRVGREADAEDLAQATLWTAYEKLDRYDPRRRFGPWLFTIAVRKAIDHGRASRRRPAAEPRGDTPYAGLAGNEPGPLQRAIDAEAGDGLWKRADALLPKNQWTALWLVYGEGLTPAEAGKALGVSRVNARVLLHRARKTLAADLAIARAHTHVAEYPVTS